VFGVADIKVHVVNGFDLQEVRLLGHGAGFGFRGFCGCSHSASFDEIREFYDKGCSIAIEKLTRVNTLQNLRKMVRQAAKKKSNPLRPGDIALKVLIGADQRTKAPAGVKNSSGESVKSVNFLIRKTPSYGRRYGLFAN